MFRWRTGIHVPLEVKQVVERDLNDTINKQIRANSVDTVRSKRVNHRASVGD